MLLRVSFFVCLTLSSASAFAQLEIDESKMVGFACFFEGRQTKIVTEVGKLLKKKKYKAIRAMLTSDNPARNYLAVICLERLSTQNKLQLTHEEEKLIAQIKQSDERLPVCSGCIPMPDIPLHEAFAFQIPFGADLWLERHL